MTDKKKTPKDYGNFQFRVGIDEMDLLHEEIEEVVRALNRKQGDDDRVIRKNDVILEALRLGLPLVKKNGIKG